MIESKCEICKDKKYLVSTRDDGEDAIEACDNCREDNFYDEDAAKIAKLDGVDCFDIYPCFVKQSIFKYYENKLGYLICTKLPVDINKLKGVSVIDSLEKAEDVFRTNNNLDIDDGVFIPSIIEKYGQLYGEGLNSCFCEVDETIEDYISQYDF
jgi:CRISPR/Cas system-associated protein Cas10 (large subunit of type III CRISPR-Cas system)